MAYTSCGNFDISVARHVRESAAKEPTVEFRDSVTVHFFPVLDVFSVMFAKDG
jgi:hypothetical protein